MIELVLTSQLNRVFLDRELNLPLLESIDALQGEKISFQAAYRATRKIPSRLKLELSGSDLLTGNVTSKRVGNTVVEFLSNSVLPESKELGFENNKPGLYPDPLKEDIELAHCCVNCSYAFWVEINLPADLPPGNYPLSVRVHNDVEPDKDGYLASESVTVQINVAAAKLAPNSLRNTHWFYCDCICKAHNCEMFSERFWTIIERYFRDMSAHDINMLLTPIFTPPLDTAPGSERMSCQLVDITLTNGKYSFNFSKLTRWIELAKSCGIEYFEMSHLFTQWGAKFTPKIEVKVNGVKEKLFSWDVEAGSDKYKDFLNQFLPALTRYLKRHKVADNCYFHVSDEPWDACLDSYETATNLVKPLLKGFKIIDAASHAEFYTKGIVALPIPGESEMDKFIGLGISERWTYYCGGHELPCSNRLHTMPLSANRIMGVLLYVYEVEGFLHWGYNFWNSGMSRRFCNVLSTEPDWDYNAGDGYLVYPGDDAPLSSQRYEVFFQGLQDLRALKTLESKVGRDKVMKLLTDCAGMEIKMDKFPLNNEFLFKMRRQINLCLCSN